MKLGDSIKIIVVYEILITTKNKKNYAGLLAAELGNLINQPAENRMDIKGEMVRSCKTFLIAGNPLELMKLQQKRNLNVNAA